MLRAPLASDAERRSDGETRHSEEDLIAGSAVSESLRRGPDACIHRIVGALVRFIPRLTCRAPHALSRIHRRIRHLRSAFLYGIPGIMRQGSALFGPALYFLERG